MPNGIKTNDKAKMFNFITIIITLDNVYYSIIMDQHALNQQDYFYNGL